MRTRLTAATLTAATLLTLAACSSGSSNDKTNPDPAAAAPTTAAVGKQDAARAALTKSVQDYTAKLFNGDASGYDLVSARCKKQLTHDAWTALAKQGHQQYGSQKATGIHIDQISGDLARVTYGAGGIPQFDREGQPWTREGGIWRWDACQTS